MRNRVNYFGVVISIVIVYCSFFFSPIGLVGDNDISIAELLYKYPSKTLMYSRFDVANIQFGNWFYFLLPICISFPTVVYFCEELRQGVERYIILRVGGARYYSLAWRTIMLNALFILIISTAAFLVTVYAVFPDIPEYGNWEMVGGVDSTVFWGKYALLFFNVIVCSALIVEMAMFFSVINHDKYVALTGSFLISYILYDKSVPVVVFIILSAFFNRVTKYIFLKTWRCVNYGKKGYKPSEI